MTNKFPKKIYLTLWNEGGSGEHVSYESEPHRERTDDKANIEYVRADTISDMEKVIEAVEKFYNSEITLGEFNKALSNYKENKDEP